MMFRRLLDANSSFSVQLILLQSELLLKIIENSYALELKAQLKFNLHFLLMQKEENMAKRESQSMALLQKLIRLDSKDCNFHFKDDIRGVYFKVSYPQTNTDNNSNEGLLRQLWHHIYAHYFKKIQHQEQRRLHYIKSIFNTSNKRCHSNASPFHALLPQGIQFQKDLYDIFSDSYLGKLSSEIKSDKEAKIWLKNVYMNSKIVDLQEQMSKEKRKKYKVIHSKLKQNRKHRRMLKVKKTIEKAQKQDEQEIDEILEELNDLQKSNKSQIDQEIQKLQRQLNIVSNQQLTYIENVQKQIEGQNGNKSCGKSLLIGCNQRSVGTAKDLECLEYLVRCLEQKQIAESVSKIISTERANGEIKFQVTYEKAINIEPKLVTEKELSRINFLRETSLVNFYRTGVKSTYSFICHNYVGFRQLMQNRQNITTKLKDKCLIQMMKKGACLASLGQIQHQMSKFHMCHHCKFLYQDYLLFTCKFSSDKQSLPKINIEASCDPNLAQVFQQGPNKNRTSQRFMSRKKNCLTSYAKIHDQYVCGRKYCFSCLKDAYSHENIRQNGLCPFCLGVCVCTRCLRNEKIAKFKNMYSILGGDLAKIQQNSDLEQLQIKSEDQAQRTRGRPKKHLNSHISINITQKKLRKFDQKQNFSSSLILLAKKKRKNNLYSLWRKNDSGNDTQQQADQRRKKRRGVGRPRIEIKKYIQIQ